MMKKLFYLCLLLGVLLNISCSKEEKLNTGSLEVKISYFFNEAQGYKSDVGASIYLFDQTGKSINYEKSSPRIGRLVYVGTETDVFAKLSADTDGTGIAKIDNIPFGDYLLVAKSKGRFLFSVKPVTINKATHTEVKNFGYKDEYSKTGESW